MPSEHGPQATAGARGSLPQTFPRATDLTLWLRGGADAEPTPTQGCGHRLLTSAHTSRALPPTPAPW